MLSICRQAPFDIGEPLQVEFELSCLGRVGLHLLGEAERESDELELSHRVYEIGGYAAIDIE